MAGFHYTRKPIDNSDNRIQKILISNGFQKVSTGYFGNYGYIIYGSW